MKPSPATSPASAARRWCAPYDDPFVIAGQGTVGREIAEDMAALGLTPDIVVAPASGGGLIAGVATAVKARYPQAMLMSPNRKA